MLTSGENSSGKVWKEVEPFPLPWLAVWASSLPLPSFTDPRLLVCPQLRRALTLASCISVAPWPSWLAWSLRVSRPGSPA